MTSRTTPWTRLSTAAEAVVMTGLRQLAGPVKAYVDRAGSFCLVQVILAISPGTTPSEAYRVKRTASGVVRGIEGVIIVDVRVVARFRLQDWGL
ncbi:MAG: hypothetical protein ACP5HK_04425 [Acidilobus sp.]